MPKRKCVVSNEMLKAFPSFKKGKSDSDVICKICNANLSIAHKGKKDIEDHTATEKHQKNLKSQAGTSKLDVFVRETSKDTGNLVKAAEATLAYHTVKHHQSFNSMDCTTKIHKKMYQDSSISKSVSCGHTKVEAIVNGVLGPSAVKAIKNQINGISFIGISTDASNHNAIKMFPVLIQYFDFKKGGIQIKLVDICSSGNETSETVTDLLFSVLEKFELTKKCISFSGDNCNTNFGGIKRAGQNNIFSRLKSKINNNLIGIGCPAHVINNAVQASCDILPIDIESIVLKLFNYFNIYTVRVPL